MARHAPHDLIGQGHAQPQERHDEPEAAASAGRAGIRLLPGEHSGSLCAALLKVARYPNVSVAERRDSTVA